MLYKTQQIKVKHKIIKMFQDLVVRFLLVLRFETDCAINHGRNSHKGLLSQL